MKEPVRCLGRAGERAREDLRVRDEKSLLTAHSRSGEVDKRQKVGSVERAAGSEHRSVGHIRRVHAVEQEHRSDSREVARLAENRSHRAMAGGVSHERETSDTHCFARPRRELARDAGEQ